MNLGKNPMDQDRYPISVWRVCLPTGIDRESYIKKCFLSGTISVIDEFAERQNNVKIGKLALQCVVFPLDEDSVGSEVVCASTPYGGKLYVIDVYSNEGFDDQGEQEYRLVRASSNGGYAEVRIDGKGNILVCTDGQDQSQINIIAKDSRNDARININVQGHAQITTSKSADISSKKITHNQGEEPILLGNQTVDLMKKILDQLGIESAGPYPILGQSVYKQLVDELEKLKSKLSFVK